MSEFIPAWQKRKGHADQGVASQTGRLFLGGNRMPFYRFQIEVPMSQQRVMERIRSLVREKQSFRQWFRELRNPQNSTSPLPPFIGSANEDSFRISNLRPGKAKSGFLPQIHGYVLPTPTGTQINVTMSLHPADAVFTIFWLVVWGSLGIAAIWTAHYGIAAAIFLFGGGFIYMGVSGGAFVARRMLTDVFSESKITAQASGSSAP
jgi:hypothetical protein